ncbi:MAG: hypothetical protein KC585_01010 [Candidatus Magasanikbacteria bacterium]|nr:hypothetical protein [Candidatus Magasanikbacteria bacterium]
MDISEVSLGTMQGHISKQQSLEKDLKKVKAVLRRILQDDPVKFDAVMEDCLKKQSIEQQIVLVCDEGIRLCTTPESPYFALGLHKHIIDCAMELRLLTETEARLRVLNVCAKWVRTQIKKEELAKRIADMLYIAASPDIEPMAIAVKAVELLPSAKYVPFLMRMRKYYQDARGE